MAFETRKVWTSSRLPSLPLIGINVLELSSRPDVTNREYLELLRSDDQLAKRIIAAANSPLAATSRPLATLGQVLDEIGQASMTSLTLSLCIYQTCLPSEDCSAEQKLAWQHSVLKGVAAEILCEQVRDGLECEYFLAGLLLDIGRFAMLRTVPQQYLGLQVTAREEWLPLWEAEQRHWGVSSAELGSQLIEQWGFPNRLVQGIQTQYAPTAVLKELNGAADCPLTQALALASMIGHYLCGDQQAFSLFRIRELTQNVVSLTDTEMQQILIKVVQRYASVAPVLGLGDCPLPDLNDLKARAIAQLTQYCQRSSSTTPGQKHRATTQSSLSNPAVQKVLPRVAKNPENFTVYDSLTKVYSQEYFEEALKKEVHRCCQTASPVGVALIRIDQFAELKTKWGAEFSDALLKHIGHHLKEMLRSADTIGRLDEEFGVLACDPTAKGMQRLADRIRAKIAQQGLEWEGKTIHVTICVGATMVLPKRDEVDLAACILTTAVQALEEANGIGENATHFESLVDEVELRRLFLSNQFRFSRWLISQGVLDIPRVAKALLDFKQRPLRMGDLAIRQELLTMDQVDLILNDQKQSQDRFGQIAVRMGLLSEDQLIGLMILQQENPLRVAELFLSLGILEQDRLQELLKEYFGTVPWAAPLTSAA